DLRRDERSVALRLAGPRHQRSAPPERARLREDGGDLVHGDAARHPDRPGGDRADAGARRDGAGPDEATLSTSGGCRNTPPMPPHQKGATPRRPQAEAVATRWTKGATPRRPHGQSRRNQMDGGAGEARARSGTPGPRGLGTERGEKPAGAG